MTSKFHVASDLHLEFKRWEELEVHIGGGMYHNTTDADILILAGDVTPDLQQYEFFLNYITKQYKHVVAIAGNHEFYGKNLYDQLEGLKRVFSRFDNAYFLDNESIILDAIKIFGGTCWTDLSYNADEVQRGMNDFIQISGRRAELTIKEWREQHDRFRKALCLESDVDIIVSHHIPDMKFIGGEYKCNVLNAGYASTDMHNLLAKASVWCYGHTHEPSFIETDTTKFICNPVGYWNYEISQYNNQLTFEV